MNFFGQCYHDTSQVTDELVQIILSPGLEPGAVEVFLEFICYSGGPLPEELLPLVKVSLHLTPLSEEVGRKQMNVSLIN